MEKIEFDRIINFTHWVEKNFGYTVGGGIWKHSLQYSIQMFILQKWLREEHGVELFIYRTMVAETGEKYGVECEKWFNNTDAKDVFNYYEKTYEEALEKGLQEALKLI